MDSRSPHPSSSEDDLHLSTDPEANKSAAADPHEFYADSDEEQQLIDSIRTGRLGVYSKRKNKTEMSSAPEPCRRKKSKRQHSDDETAFDYFFNATRNRRLKAFTELVRTLTPLQREAVQEIGFGGLLHFRIISIPDQMNEWLIDSFDPVSHYFSCGGKIRFSLTATDASRVFGVKVNKDKIVGRDISTDGVRGVLRRWRDYYKLEFDGSLDLKTVGTMVRRLKQGGDDFKRFFVLFAMQMILTPDYGRNVDLGLVHSVVDVETIKDCNWAGYIVQHLCETVYNYKARKPRGIRGCAGCLMLLQVTYFHNTIWPDSPLPSDEPLIKHWSGMNIERRVLSEAKTRGFGSLLFKKTTSPVVTHECSSQVKVGGLDVGSSNGTCVVRSQTDANLAESIPQADGRLTWKLISAVDQVICSYAVSQDISIQNVRYSCFRRVGDSFSQFDARQAYDTVVVNLFKVCCRLSPELGKIGPNLSQVADPVVERTDSESVRVTSPWREWTFHYPLRYSSDLLKKVAVTSHDFSPYQLEVADYCMAGGDASDFIFDDGRKLRLRRAGIWSLDTWMNANPETLTVFSMVLNNEWIDKRITSRLCLGCIKLDDDSVDQDMVVERWNEWMQFVDIDINGAAFVLIPVSFAGDYFLVVLNFVDCVVQCCVAAAYKPGISELCEEKGRLIGKCFCKLLELYKAEARLEVFRGFSYDLLVPSWAPGQSCCDLSISCCDQSVSVMHMMECFKGSGYTLDSLRLNEERKNTQLRVSYLCRITLSRSNTRRQFVLDECRLFLEGKGEELST